jgi:hypothetical protein
MRRSASSHSSPAAREAIAALAYDENGDPIGFHDVMIVNASEPLADRDVPEL